MLKLSKGLCCIALRADMALAMLEMSDERIISPTMEDKMHA